MERNNNHLDNKVDYLKENQPKLITTACNPKDIPEIVNLTNIEFTDEEYELLNFGLQHSVERPLESYLPDLIIETELAIKLLDPNIRNIYRHRATNKLKQIINTNNKQNPEHKIQLYIIKQINERQLHIMKQINKKLEKGNAILTQAENSKSIVIINTEEYKKKEHMFIEKTTSPHSSETPQKNTQI
jgi:hypothetical protein